jgi:type II secretory pathway pseudopilin PulG
MAKFNLHNNKRPARTCFKMGFTLLEALVATSILMVAVAAPITIAQKGLSSAVYSKNQMIASYLAQDAIEYVKNKRDENFIQNKTIPTNWLAGFSNCLPDVSEVQQYCAIDTKAGEGAVGLIYDDERKLIKKEVDSDSNFEFYGYGSGTDTIFTRKVSITPHITPALGVDAEALITVTVSWGSDNVVVKTLIYNY